jgi:lambda family phage portal protein
MNAVGRVLARLARVVGGKTSAPVQAVTQIRRIEARYDAALTDEDNRRHWILADGLSAKTANTWAVRWQLRSRARYEVANNSYAKGIVLTLANDCVGTGPRLQCLTGDEPLNRLVEREFGRWARAVSLTEKLHTMVKARTVDGEAFGLFVTNPGIPGEIKFDLKLVEADQVHTPALNPIDPYKVDGIEFDENYNPITYHVLKFHPGDVFPQPWVFSLVPARHCVHWFRHDRPGQARGVPDITPALPLFAQLRRYTLATLSAAETAANIAATLRTEAPANPDDMVYGMPFDVMQIERNSMMTLPAGYQAEQFRPEQPTTTYPDFKKEILNEIARCLNMPFNIAACNSASYNYSSGRLDHQIYFRMIEVERTSMENEILDRILRHWLYEAVLVGLVPGVPYFERLGLEGEVGFDDFELQVGALYPHQWFWDGFGHIDPEKEAKAQETRLRNYTTTLRDEFARNGQDWRDAMKQRAAELAFISALGMPPAGTSPLPPAEQPAPPEDTPPSSGDRRGPPERDREKGDPADGAEPDLSEQTGEPARRRYPEFDKQGDKEQTYASA